MKLHLKENDEKYAFAQMNGWAIEYRNMNSGYHNLLCFKDLFDAKRCEDDFYTLEDFPEADEEFWEIFESNELFATAKYEEIDWRNDIHKDFIDGEQKKVYTDNKGNSWIIVNKTPFDFYL